ncbi:hypothetical protein [Pseudovibrio brasiliensis]|uniref:Uncharacterized protein n=1 Tax=Pseudovibrio brasiliensis TaxID=1898042 RepID=A0ABX8ANY8_9HYPH|nr:hypothetical protein [Pseudovibrio brasiliensis]QUS55615.1 hypothetical protein KGB56_20295 [Pseudovibrio brasiliensis]
MAYHIPQFKNKSSGHAVTANPKTDRDTYFVRAGADVNSSHNVLINKGNWSSFSAAFGEANYIYTGTEAYCFWDSGDSELVIASQSGSSLVRLKESAGDLDLLIDANGSINFVRV